MKARAILTHNPVKAALEVEVQASAKPVKCNKLFSDIQEKSRTPKQLKKYVRRVGFSEAEDESLY
jgi:hypothetical protein